MVQSHPKTAATWVLPVSIAFTGLCIFGAGLVIHEPLEKIATRESHTVIIKQAMTEPLVIGPTRP